MTLFHIRVGDTVVISRPYYRNPSRPAKVVRVGRKYLYVAGDSTRYDRETGRGNDSLGNTFVQTMVAFELSRRVDLARRELLDFGIEVSRQISDEVCLSIRQALIHIIPSKEVPT